MKIGPIPVVVKNGRVEAKAREHWRLVMPTERGLPTDEFTKVSEAYGRGWYECGLSDCVYRRSGLMLHRRRVKGGT